MAIDDAFFASLADLRAPTMGTEAVAPLLYWLVRSLRPRSALEVGMGYTSAFIARALADNADDYARDRARMVDKTRQIAGAVSEGRISPEKIWDWICGDPVNGRPGYYREEVYSPMLYAIDSMEAEHSSAPKVQAALRRLGIDRYITVLEGSFEGMRGRVDALGRTLDLVFFDAGEVGESDVRFLEEYWTAIDPSGGMFLSHEVAPAVLIDVLGARFGERPIRDFEVLHLPEPHKLRQNALTLIRRVKGWRPAPDDASTVERAARELVAQADARAARTP